MADLDPALIEKMREALQQRLPSVLLLARHVEVALLSLGIPAAALNAIARGEAVARAPVIARPLDEWHEDFGPALWWFFPICEPPYVGSPLDQDWPGYHTHWTPIECPSPPAPTGVSHERKR